MAKCGFEESNYVPTYQIFEQPFLFVSLFVV